MDKKRVSKVKKTKSSSKKIIKPKVKKPKASPKKITKQKVKKPKASPKKITKQKVKKSKASPKKITKLKVLHKGGFAENIGTATAGLFKSFGGAIAEIFNEIKYLKDTPRLLGNIAD